MTVSQGEIADLMKQHPRQEGEELTAWFDRVYALAQQEARLPYRDPGEEG